MVIMSHVTKHLIAPLSDIPIFYANYLTMHKVHMHAGTIRHLLYGCVYAREDNPLAKAYTQTIQ